MEAIKKGTKVPKVEATCTKCGKKFLRSAVHPYIVDCPECRSNIRSTEIKIKKVKNTTNKHLKCTVCKSLIQSVVSRIGMYQCPKCKDQWWTNCDGFWRRWNDDDVFKNSEYVGTLRESSYEAIYGVAPLGKVQIGVQYGH